MGFEDVLTVTLGVSVWTGDAMAAATYDVLTKLSFILYDHYSRTDVLRFY